MGTSSSLLTPGGGSCTVTITDWNALAALVSSSSLTPGCWYVFPHTQGTLGTVEVWAYAVDVDAIETDVQVRHASDLNKLWRGVFDFGFGGLVEVRDNLGNWARDFASVSSFPWGDPLWTNNTAFQSVFNLVGLSTSSVNCNYHFSTVSTNTVGGSVAFFDSTFISSYIDIQAPLTGFAYITHADVWSSNIMVDDFNLFAMVDVKLSSNSLSSSGTPDIYLLQTELIQGFVSSNSDTQMVLTMLDLNSAAIVSSNSNVYVGDVTGNGIAVVTDESDVVVSTCRTMSATIFSTQSTLYIQRCELENSSFTSTDSFKSISNSYMASTTLQVTSSSIYLQHSDMSYATFSALSSTYFGYGTTIESSIMVLQDILSSMQQTHLRNAFAQFVNVPNSFFYSVSISETTVYAADVEGLFVDNSKIVHSPSGGVLAVSNQTQLSITFSEISGLQLTSNAAQIIRFETCAFNGTVSLSSNTLAGQLLVNNTTVDNGSAISVAQFVSDSDLIISSCSVASGGSLNVLNKTVSGICGVYTCSMRSSGSIAVTSTPDPFVWASFDVANGSIIGGGGASANIVKSRGGFLDLVNFNHFNVMHATSTSVTLTAPNSDTSRDDFHNSLI